MVIFDREIIGQILWFATAVVAVFGLCVGSFLNVVVWRMPQGMSLSHPGSHCPKCGHAIRPWENIPVISWLLLRAKCSQCGLPISIRYPLVEAATGLLWVILWKRLWASGLPLTHGPAWFVLGSLLVAITLIDIENLIIPDKLNLVGGVVALASALAFPATHAVLEGSPDSALSYRLYQFIGEAGDQPRVWAVVHLAAGAIVGFGLLWCVRTLGRRFWGRAVTQPESPATWLLAKGSLSIDGTDAVSLSALLPNPKDRAIVEIESGQLRDRKGKTHELGQGTVAVGREDVTVAGETRALGKGTKLELQATSWSMPREVLGRGDLKMMAMVGAFVGPDAVLFVVTLGSLLGLVIGGGWVLVTGREKRAIPFGPFLAVATLARLLAGPEMLAAYSSWLRSLIGAPA